MSDLKQYNTDALFLFPLVEDGGADFVGDYTPAAGDAKVFTTRLISTNPTALILGFDSLTEIPVQGAQLNESGAGTAEGIVAFTIITSGTPLGGDATGFFFMRSVTGQAWSNNDQIDIEGGNTDIATVDDTTYDLAVTAGLIAALGNGMFAAALSPTEMSSPQGAIYIVDSATKAIEDQAINFETYGNTDALHAFNLNTATQDVNVTQISGDSGAADNLELDYDGTGYDKSNSTIGTTTTNTDMVGTNSAATATDLLDKLGAVDESAAAGDPSATESVMQYVKQIVNILTGSTGIVTMPSAAAPANNISIAEMIRAIYDDTNSLDGTKIPDTLSLANINTQVDGAFTTQMADSVPADGTIPTREQAIYMIIQMLTDFSISGTTLTVRKVDGSTTLMTFTLDDGTNPTDISRTT